MAREVVRRRLPSLLEATAQRFVGHGSPFRIWTESWNGDDDRFVLSVANAGGSSRARVTMDSNGRLISIDRWPAVNPGDPIAVPDDDCRAVVVEILPLDCSLGAIVADDAPAGGPLAPAERRLFPVEALPVAEPEPPPPPPTDPRLVPAPDPDQLKIV